MKRTSQELCVMALPAVSCWAYSTTGCSHEGSKKPLCLTHCRERSVFIGESVASSSVAQTQLAGFMGSEVSCGAKGSKT